MSLGASISVLMINVSLVINAHSSKADMKYRYEYQIQTAVDYPNKKNSYANSALRFTGRSIFQKKQLRNFIH